LTRHRVASSSSCSPHTLFQPNQPQLELPTPTQTHLLAPCARVGYPHTRRSRSRPYHSHIGRRLHRRRGRCLPCLLEVVLPRVYTDSLLSTTRLVLRKGLRNRSTVKVKRVYLCSTLDIISGRTFLCLHHHPHLHRRHDRHSTASPVGRRGTRPSRWVT
jgi:hypothetical protein